MTDIDILLCYRGRYHNQIDRLDSILGSYNLRVTYDSKILADPANYTEAEIEWLPMGDSAHDERVAWRGPLSEAVKRSTLVAFLVDSRDPSPNVMNEIAWAARAGKPLFVIFDTKAKALSENLEGMNIGMLQGFYAWVAQRPDLQEFGYAFVTHEEDNGLDERLTVLINRLVSYLGRVKQGELERVSLNQKTTLADVENAPQARAHRRLLQVQEKISKTLGIAIPPNQGDVFKETLDLLYQRERDGAVRDGRIWPRDSPFSYPEQSERERYRRTEALVNRIHPGPFEFPYYLASLARELVSIEMVLPRRVQQVILIGTVPFCPSNFPVEVLSDADFDVLLVDATYLDFVHQMLQTAVKTWKVTWTPGTLPVIGTNPDDLRDMISANPSVVTGFARSLEQMLNKGIVSEIADGAPQSATSNLALSMFDGFQQRFNIAVAMARIALLGPGGRRIQGQQNETASIAAKAAKPAERIVAADTLAAQWVFDSARQLDQLDPTMALEAILLSLGSQALIERALTGFVPPELVPSSMRMEKIAASFEAYVCSLGVSGEEAKDRRNSAQSMAATLNMLWKAATDARTLDATTLHPAPRWRPHIRQ
jgi:hypothetical protein